jgi:hypothetical protein
VQEVMFFAFFMGTGVFQIIDGGVRGGGRGRTLHS